MLSKGRERKRKKPKEKERKRERNRGTDMKNAGKTIAIILIVVIVLACAVGGFIFYKVRKTAVGGEAALDAALKDAGLDRSAVYDVEKDYEYQNGDAWYEIEFKSNGVEYHYDVDAKTGAVRGSNQNNDD